MKDSFRIIKHYSNISKRYGNWIVFMDMRSDVVREGRKGRKLFIKEVEQLFGPLGLRWQFQQSSDYEYILKLDDERDLLFFLLKFNRR
jgi:hypothetical protein